MCKMNNLLRLFTAGKKKNDALTAAPTKKIVCKNCKTEYTIPLSANFISFCPTCKELNGIECEYGFAPITPCEIYLGEKQIGRLLGSGGSFRLECRALKINTPLTKGYKNAEVYNEAIDLIKERLK